MKRNFCMLLVSFCMVSLLFTGCKSEKGDDLFIGKYVSIDDEVTGDLQIRKAKGEYKIQINLDGLTKIEATGETKGGTLFYEGTDKDGNSINGNIEEYGDDYPIRVEFYGDGLFDEIEFERK